MAKAAAIKVIKKKNGRYMVRQRGGALLKGEDKIKVLMEKKLIKTSLPKPAEPEAAPAEEAPSEG